MLSEISKNEKSNICYVEIVLMKCIAQVFKKNSIYRLLPYLSISNTVKKKFFCSITQRYH